MFAGFDVEAFCAESGVSTVSALSASISNSERVYRMMTSLLLGLLILWCRSEDVAAVLIGHAAAKAVVRSVPGTEAFDVDDLSDHELILADAAAHQLPGRAARQCPHRGRAVRILDLDVVPDVRVRPLDLLQRAGQFDRLLIVELGGEGMMREQP